MEKPKSAKEFAQLIQTTTCMIDALKKTANPISKRARYLDSAQFLIIMAFDPESIDKYEEVI